MSFITLNPAQIAAAEPVTQDLFELIKDDLDDHESRILDVEAATISTFPIEFLVKGHYWKLGGGQLGVAFVRAEFNLTLTAARLFVVDDGSSGTLQIDVQKKRGAGAFATIFSTQPSVVQGGGDYQTSTNAAFSDTDIDAGDILRLDITTVMDDNEDFQVYLPYEVDA